MHKLAQRSTFKDVRIAHSHRRAIGGHLNRAARPDKGPKRAEKEMHQVRVPPPHKRMGVEEAPHGSSMRKVVVHCSEAFLMSPEARVHSKSRAVHAVPNFATEILELLDCF